MSRQLVVCMDGSWNDPAEQTNVRRLFEMLPGDERRVEESGPIRSHLVKSGDQVVAWYLDGVGKNGRQRGLLAGTHGISQHDRIIDAYLLLARIYERGDKIWLFGFSRGAWAARCLGAFVVRSGLIPPTEADDDAAADNAERIWLNYKEGRGVKRGGRFWRYHDETPLRMIGVWETVGELGVPVFDGMRLIEATELGFLQFSNRDLSPRVEHGRQSLAIDEARADFAPTLWTPREGVKQVWFPGAHADVGGGYEQRGLSDVALAWMVQEVNDLDAGLHLDPRRLSQALAADSLQNRHDETRGTVWRTRTSVARRLPDDADLDPSVFERMRARTDYRPLALKELPSCAAFYRSDEDPVEETLDAERETPSCRRLPLDGSVSFPTYAHKWWNASGVEVEVGERYRIEASGTWIDKGVPAGANGYESKSWFLHLAEGSRRMAKRPWFSLIAAIHPRPDLEANNPDSENLLTGLVESTLAGVARIDDESSLMATPNGCEIEVVEPGFLYFFANDSAFSYANNSGFLTVEVTRLPSAVDVGQRPPPVPDQVPGSLDLQLYFTPGTSSLAAHIALREAGLDFDLVCVDLGKHVLADGSDFKAINPNGYVPVLELTDGERLTEVASILQYIADRVPESGLAPQPYTLERYRLQEWLSFIGSELHQAFIPLFRADTPSEQVTALKAKLARRLGSVNTGLTERDYLLGEHFSVADGYLFVVLGWAKAVGLDLGHWPALAAFENRVAQRRSVREAIAAERSQTGVRSAPD